MEFHEAVAICIVIAMAFVIDSTVKLYKYRKKNEIQNLKGPLRDIAIMRDPTGYQFQEARLTIRNWLSCGVLLALMAAFLIASPPSLRQPGGDARDEPAAPVSDGAERVR